MLVKCDERYRIECDEIAGSVLESHVIQHEDGLEITITAQIESPIRIGDWQVRVRPNFVPDFTYTPHLTPDERYVIDMHVFRTPALMMGNSEQVICVLPIVDGVKNGAARYYLDMDVPGHSMMLGITTTKIAEHVLYQRTNQAVLPQGVFTFKFCVMVLHGESVKNPFRSVLQWWWGHYGQRQAKLLPSCRKLMPYVRRTYAWVIEKWQHVTWNECMLNGALVGAPQMIVLAHESLNNPEKGQPRAYADIWNQAWFSSLRSAQGLYRFAKENENEAYLEKVLLTKELALQMPQEDGLFDSVLLISREGTLKDKKYLFGNSDRNPYREKGIVNAPRHILDMSWTALQMLTWYEELEKDERLLAYVQRYAERLLQLQDEDGYFPGWINKEDSRPIEILRQSPESAVSVTLLVKLYNLTQDPRYWDSAQKCMETLVRDVMPHSRWEDFETYWSCSTFGQKTMVGKKFLRNNCYKQCSLSPFWMAQALLACYHTVKEQKYLAWGERCLDEMLMYQSSFQPDYMPVTVVGGFGVMNADAELNDARQSLFAEVILEYGKELSRPEYIERGLAALCASFSMMYCPENPVVKQQWEQRIPYFNEKDYGFMMENYGHDGYAADDGQGIGVKGPGAFTIYDWGNGAASEAVMRIRAHFPELFQNSSVND